MKSCVCSCVCVCIDLCCVDRRRLSSFFSLFVSVFVRVDRRLDLTLHSYTPTRYTLHATRYTQHARKRQENCLKRTLYEQHLTMSATHSRDLSPEPWRVPPPRAAPHTLPWSSFAVPLLGHPLLKYTLNHSLTDIIAVCQLIQQTTLPNHSGRLKIERILLFPSPRLSNVSFHPSLFFFFFFFFLLLPLLLLLPEHSTLAPSVAYAIPLHTVKARALYNNCASAYTYPPKPLQPSAGKKTLNLFLKLSFTAHA